MTARILQFLRAISAFVVMLSLYLSAPLIAHGQTVQPGAASQVTVSAVLQSQLTESKAPVSFLIILQEQVDAQALLGAHGLRTADRVSKAQLLYTQLTSVARRTQAPLLAWLSEHGIPYRAFYIVNMIEVEGDAATAAALQQLPGIARLEANPAVGQELTVATPARTWLQPLTPNLEFSAPFSPASETSEPTTEFQGGFLALAQNAQVAQSFAMPYGLDDTHAPAVWALGYRGQGIVVASQDTGVEWDHPALMAEYRGAISDTVAMTYTVDHIYNWFDAWPLAGRPSRCDSDPQVPCDDHGHGTHTVGTMVGDATAAGRGIYGMAPEAKWIGCRNMDHGTGTPASYAACFEFFLAPYPQDGDPMTDGKPELAPKIINNSWGCPPSEGCDTASLRQVVETARAAGQMVVASAGNSGSSCNSVKDPIAIHDATFTVGAVSSSGFVAGFSSRGPVTVDGSSRLKPDLTAPGVSVESAYVGHNYAILSGTSMASPHVAGAIALLWSAVPTLTGQIDLTEQVLIKSAVQVPFNQCGEGPAVVVPNNTYGYGRLDILAAVELAQQPAALTVHVVDRSAAPVASVALTITDQLTGYTYPLLTDSDGVAQLPTLYAGDYRVTVSDSTAYETPVVTVDLGAASDVVVHELAPAEYQLFFPMIRS